MPGGRRGRGRGRGRGRARGRVYAGRRRAGRYAARRRGLPSRGYLKLSRKLPLISMYGSTAVPGGLTLNDPTGTCMTLGTPAIITGTTNCYDIPFSLKFRLDQVAGSTDLTNIADKYKINSVKVQIHANNANMSFAGNVGAAQTWVEYIQDHDDAGVPTANAMREKMGVRTKYFSAAKYIVAMGVKPRVADVVFQNGITNAYAVNRSSQWLNMSYPGVEHYAIKGILRNVPLIGTANGNVLFDVDVTQYLTIADIQ